MADTETLRDYSVTDGKDEFVARLPAAWTTEKVDQELSRGTYRRVKSYVEQAQDSVMPEHSIGTPEALARTAKGTLMTIPAAGMDWWKNATLTEKAIMLGTLPLGGEGLLAKAGASAAARMGARIGLGAAERETMMGLGERAAMGALRVGRAGVAGGAGALGEQALGYEQPTSVKLGVIEGITAGLAGEGSMAFMNLLSRSLGRGLATSVTDPRDLVTIMSKFDPGLTGTGATTKERLAALWDGRMFTQALQQLEEKKAVAITLQGNTAIHAPSLGAAVEKVNLPSLQRPTNDLFTTDQLFTAWRKIAGYARDEEGAKLTGVSAKWYQDALGMAEKEAKATMDPKAFALWRAGRASYAQLNELGRLIEESKPTLDFNNIQSILLDRYKHGTAARQFLGDAYNTLLEGSLRGGKPLEGLDVHGEIRTWFSMRGHAGMSGITLPRMAGAPGAQAPASLGGQAVRVGTTMGVENLFAQPPQLPQGVQGLIPGTPPQ